MGDEFNTQDNMNQGMQNAGANQSYLEQERLLRTYKGIEFVSVDAMNQVKELEKTYSVQCTQLQGKTYAELNAIRQELINRQLPEAIFGGFVAMISNAANTQEGIEIAELKNSLAEKDLESLIAFGNQINGFGFSQNGTNDLYAYLPPLIRKRQEEKLEQITGDVSADTKEQCADKKTQILQLNYPGDVAQSFLQKIEEREDFLEVQEIEALCAGYENKNIDELKELLVILCGTTYREKFTVPYRVKIDAKMDEIYTEQMTTLCADLEQSEKPQVIEMKQKLDEIECKAAIKAPFYQRVAQRLDDLDRMELEALCANVETKTLEELETLYTTLTTQPFNPKYINKFAFSTELYLNKARQAHLEEITKDLFTMDKAKVEELEATIQQLGYEPRRTKQYEMAIHARKIELDLYELNALCSNFNSLNGKQVSDMIATVSQNNMTVEAKNQFLMKLNQRLTYLSYEEVTPYAVGLSQFMNSIGFNDPSILLAGLTNNFHGEWDRIRAMIPNANPVEVPIAIVTMGSLCFVMTKTTCYYQSKKSFFAVPVAQIAGFGVTKKLLSEAVVIQDKTGNFMYVDGSISKKISGLFTQTFNQLLVFLSNPSMVVAFPAAKFTVEPINMSTYASNWQQFATNETTIVNTFFQEYQMLAANHKFGNSIKLQQPNTMAEATEKISRSFGVNIVNEQILMYYDSSLFSSLKEGFAVGTKNIYVKDNGQPAFVIPYLNILKLSMGQQPKNFSLLIEIVAGGFCDVRSVNLDAVRCTALIEWLSHFVKDMQIFEFCQGAQLNMNEAVAQETQNVDAQAQNVPVQETQSVVAPVQDVQAQDVQPQVTPAQNAPAQEMQSEAVPVQNVAVQETQSVVAPVQNVPAQETQPQVTPVEVAATSEPQAQAKFCPQCGKQLKEGARFCTGCGFKLF